jgi:hypothetical protein
MGNHPMNGRASKQKGYTFEVECVRAAQAVGLQAERAWGSNGQSKGWHHEVDVLVAGKKAQCKRRAKISPVYTPNENVDVQLFRGNHGIAYACMPLSEWLKLLRGHDDQIRTSGGHLGEEPADPCKVP